MMDPSSASEVEDEEGDALTSLLGGDRGWDCDGCPPPYFDLPPPPRPDFMDDAGELTKLDTSNIFSCPKRAKVWISLNE